MFETSATTDKLDEQLAKVQGEIDTAKKDKTNPHFKSRYADLTSVWEACRAVLAKHSVSVTQWPIESADGRVHLVTRVAHKGEWMKCSFSMPVAKQDPQGYGSGLTYIRRYTLSAILGISADEDDDGNHASSPTPARAPVKNFAPRPAITPVQSDALDLALSGSAPGDYVVTVGKNTGRKVRELSKADISNFVDFYDSDEGSKQRGVKGVKEFYDNVMAYLSESRG